MTSRVAKQPISLPKGVEVTIKDKQATIKGPKGTLQHQIPVCVDVAQNDNELEVKQLDDHRTTVALAGTTRAIINNHVVGVSDGYNRILILKGVGYRAQVKGPVLHLTLGFSHPVEHKIPEGITIECPSQTEIHVKGSDKQQVGEVAARIRRYRPPEPYKGKGVRYADEVVVMKETKKK